MNKQLIFSESNDEADPKGQLLFFWGGEVQEDDNGKLNPSHFVGPSRSQGHGRPWFSAVILLNSDNPASLYRMQETDPLGSASYRVYCLIKSTDFSMKGCM